MRLVVVLIACVALGLGAAAPAVADDTPATPGPDEAVEAVLDRRMPSSGVPGVAYAVVADGQVTNVGVRGVVRAGTGDDVTPDTPFPAGSITKSVTALAVMQLVEAGRVDLDSAVAEYLDGFAGGPAAGVTVRQLLSHTSGFSTRQGNTSHTDATGDGDELARRVDRLAGLTLSRTPGVTWEYSNANYLVLGRLVEVVSGEDYDTYVQREILQPLAMADSFVADGEVHEDMATGHRPWFGTKRPLPEDRTERGMAPAGGLVASAPDLASYLLAMMNGEDDVLSAEGKALMMRPAGPASSFYGLGWFVDDGDGSVWHSGSVPGAESLAVMRPSEGTAAVVLVNGGSGIGFGETTALREGVTGTALGLDGPDDGSRWTQQALFVGLVLLPLAYLLSIVWAWRHRDAIRAKAGFPGLFSLWFPLVSTSVAAWVMLRLVPDLVGAPLGTLRLFQPDLGLLLISGAVTGVLWATVRLVIAHTGGTSAKERPQERRRPRGRPEVRHENRARHQPSRGSESHAPG
ncbi:serine hydrolase domain-containing protein [Jannaschia sp. R86511]|uniref:serine hydrolase domain-containing protein n=1 Tax=Jannaschia sp. R86511 TaxID=3093853 RepID=UPI0036D232F4